MPRLYVPGLTASSHAKIAHTSDMIEDGTIVDADISPSAAIAKTKLDIAGKIVDADISPTAAIAKTKIAMVADPDAHAARHAAGGADEITSPLNLAAIPQTLTGKIVTRVQAGLAANRPAGVNAGDIYWATDTKKLWVYDGLAWQDCRPPSPLNIRDADNPKTTSVANIEAYSHKVIITGKGKITTVNVNCTGANSYTMGIRVKYVVDGGDEIALSEQTGSGTFTKTFTLNAAFNSSIEIRFYVRNAFDNPYRNETINYSVILGELYY